MKEELLNDLKALLMKEGADLIGFCSLEEIPFIKDKGLDLGISIGISMSASSIKGLNEGPTMEYYNEYESINAKLKSLRELSINYLEEHGYHGTSVDTFDAAAYVTELPHKTVGVMSGLGWIGKSTVFVTEEYGSAVLLTSLVSDFKYEGSRNKEVKVLCGQCTKCVENCPGNAIKGVNWKPGVTREELLDMSKCRQTARRIAKEKIGIENTFCGRCIMVCPYTVRYIARSGAQNK